MHNFGADIDIDERLRPDGKHPFIFARLILRGQRAVSLRSSIQYNLRANIYTFLRSAHSAPNSFSFDIIPPRPLPR